MKMDLSISYCVNNYFQGQQYIFLDGRLLSWVNRDTGKDCYELATLGM